MNEQAFIKLAYSHRIERPEYEELNPFLNISDPYNITTGNPLLQAEIGDNFELGYNRSFKGGGNVYVALIERMDNHDIKPYTTFYPGFKVGDSTYSNVRIQGRTMPTPCVNYRCVLSASASITGLVNWK